MSTFDSGLRPFSFQRRPIPVPGDLRISWRVSLILLMLGNSRSNKASLAKLHVLNDAIRSNQHERLRSAVTGAKLTLPWNLRVEPAFARAVDFVVGEKLAGWTKASSRSALQLTAAGVSAFNQLLKMDDALVEEKAILAELAKVIPEGAVSHLLGERRNAA